MRSWFQFGTTKFDINDGLVIEQVPNQNRPARKMDVYSVPGRSGDIVVMQDAWENVEQTYEVWGGDENINSATAFGYKCAELFKYSGYQELTDSYDTTHYRRAYFAGPFDVDNEFTRRGRAQLTFNCDPRRFLNSGKTVYQIIAPSTYFTNPSTNNCRPILTIHGSGSGWVNIERADGGYQGFNIADITDGMVIDCENYDCYYDDPLNGRINLNDQITLLYSSTTEWPYFTPGENAVLFNDNTGVTSIDILPNWWDL